MVVVDIRNILADRNIQLSSVNSDCIYYLEEKNDDGNNNLFVLEYDRASRKERLVSNYSLEDPSFVEHLFTFEKNLILILENGTNSLWMIELDKKTGMLILDRILYTSTHYPANYGFIPRTYADDKDPLDVLVVCSQQIEPLTLVRCYPIGVIKMIDNGRNDEKISDCGFRGSCIRSGVRRHEQRCHHVLDAWPRQVF